MLDDLTPLPALRSGLLGQLQLRNRLLVAPMTRTSAEPDGTPTDEMADYYAEFAEGGFGLVITEGIYPDAAHSQGYLNQPGLVTEKHVAGWRSITERVHSAWRPDRRPAHACRRVVPGQPAPRRDHRTFGRDAAGRDDAAVRRERSVPDPS